MDEPAQRSLRERLGFLQAALDASPDPVVVLGRDARLVLASHAMASVLGVDPSDCSRSTDRMELVRLLFEHRPLDPADLSGVNDLIGQCLAGGIPEGGLVLKSAGELGVRIFELRALPIFSDQAQEDLATVRFSAGSEESRDQRHEVAGVFAVIRDVTEYEQTATELRQAREAADSANRAKSEFLSRMSHELRTPLNAVLGFSQLLQMDSLDMDQEQAVEQIMRAGNHLLRLIDDVLDMAKIDTGQLAVTQEVVDLGTVLADAVALLEPLAAEHSVRLQFDRAGVSGLRVSADRHRLVQVLLNLGSNGIKYNHRGGSVSFGARRERPGTIRIEVSDTGRGIPPEQVGKLFKPFSRLESPSGRVEGTGVGLALSLQLASLMHGDIGVYPAPGGGSTFWVDLPTPSGANLQDRGPSTSGRPATGAPGDPPDSDAPGDPPGEPAPSGPPEEHIGPEPAREDLDGHVVPLKVLHIEDNTSNTALVSHVLARRPGIELTSCADPGVGLELARQQVPDLVLLDLHLPGIGGDELFHRIKADPDLSAARVVVISADVTPSRIRTMFALGADGYLTKPIDIAVLLRLVDDLRGQVTALHEAPGRDEPPREAGR